MSTQTPQRSTTAQAPDVSRTATAQRMPDGGGMSHRHGKMRGTETKSAVKSTEFWIYLAAVAGTLIASWLTTRQNNGGVDALDAGRTWWLIALLTIGYLGSRGLAKAGSSWRSSDGGS